MRTRSISPVRELAIYLTVGGLAASVACTRPAASEPPQTGVVQAIPEQAGDAASERIRPGLTARSLAPDTWVVTHEELHDCNVLVARLPDGTVLLCSSPFDSDTTRALLTWVRARFAPKRMVAINTHWHMDGAGGNAAYHEANVETYASLQTQKLSAERGERMRREAALGLPEPLAEHVRDTPVVAARRTFDAEAGLTLSFGGEAVQVSYPGPAHSQDNLIVYLPARRVLFGGCMLKVGDSLGYLGDASLDGWEPALARVESLDAQVVVPGHGSVGGREIIENTRRLVRAARTQP